MSEPIKGCPQPDAPELVMRADGYHYRTEDEMKELTDEDLDRLMKENVPTAVRCPPGWRNAFRAAIDADRALNAEDHDPLEPKRLESIADPTLRAVCEAYTNTPGGHFVRLQAVAKLVHAPADQDAMRQAPATVLPDGSAFFTGSFPLPKDHWLYAPRCSEWDDARDTTADTPHPILTHEVRDSVVAAVRYAVRGATSCGAEKDFDPDAIVQNAVYALCGPYGGCTLAVSPAPPAEQSEAQQPLPRDSLYAAGKRASASGAKLRCRKCGDNYELTFNYAALRGDGVGQEGPAERQGEREPAAFIEHHKAGDNLVWDDPGGKKTALYTHPSPTLAELRAKVKAMLTSSFSGVAYTDLVRRADVLALLGDKL